MSKKDWILLAVAVVIALASIFAFVLVIKEASLAGAVYYLLTWGFSFVLGWIVKGLWDKHSVLTKEKELLKD